MIPIKLTIEGLYSYQKKQIVDFEKLTSDHIFGIFGAVGSGKSSILEAISFAIYGDTERLNKNDGRGYNMMNLKSDHFLVELDLIAGIDQKRYRVTASARRNSKRFEDVKTIERKAYVINGAELSPIDLSELERAMGLNYANFKRTIIIPQGRFQEFLQLEKKERTNMMKELFNLDRYDLFRKAASLDKRNNEKRQFLEGQISSLGDIKSEDISVLHSLLNDMLQNAKKLADTLSAKRTELDVLNRLKKLDENRAALIAEQALLDSKSNEFIEMERSLKDYEYCVVNFRSLIEQESQSELNIASVKVAIDRESLVLKKIQEALAEKRSLLSDLKVAYDNRDASLEEVSDLEFIANAKNLEVAIRSINTRIEKGTVFIEQNLKKIGELKTSLENLKLSVKEKKGQLPDVALLSTVRSWFAVHKGIETQYSDLKRDVEIAKKEVEKAGHEIEELAEIEKLERITPDVTFDELQAILQSRVSLLAEKNSLLAQELEHLMVQQKLSSYVEALSEGEPCPLCGSVHHPELLSVDNVGDAIVKIKGEKKSVEKSIEHFNSLNGRFALLFEKEKIAKERLRDLLIRASKLESDLESHNKEFIWKDYADETSVNKAFSNAEIIGNQIKNLDNDIEKTYESLQLEEANGVKFQNEVNRISKEKAEKTGEVQSQLSNLKKLKLADFEAATADELYLVSKNKRLAISTMESKYNAVLAEVADLRQKEGNHSGILSANNELLTKETVRLDAIRAELNEKFKKSGWTSMELIRKTAAQNIEVELVRKEISDFRQKQQAVNTQLVEIEKEFNGTSYDAEKHSDIDMAVRSLNEQLSINSKEIGRIESELKAKTVALEKLTMLKKDLTLTIQKALDLATIKNLLQGNKFIDYVSTTYLQNLCAAANERFHKMTRQRLQLELTEDNSFQVRDFMNGGKTRSVKTLSGGQTFQASLSLALSLSDNIQKLQHSNQNFFFLDEGFGTLDKESLSIVFDTLKSLRKENRIVGVISHVEEMQQEIETCLFVKNDEENGSLITKSWN